MRILMSRPEEGDEKEHVRETESLQGGASRIPPALHFVFLNIHLERNSVWITDRLVLSLLQTHAGSEIFTLRTSFQMSTEASRS